MSKKNNEAIAPDEALSKAEAFVIKHKTVFIVVILAIIAFAAFCMVSSYGVGCWLGCACLNNTPWTSDFQRLSFGVYPPPSLSSHLSSKLHLFPIVFSIWQFMWGYSLKTTSPNGLGASDVVGRCYREYSSQTLQHDLKQKERYICPPSLSVYQSSPALSYYLMRLCCGAHCGSAFFPLKLSAVSRNLLTLLHPFSIFLPLWVWLSETSINHLPPTDC